MARRQYTEEQKAEVRAALLSGQSINQVAKKYQIPRGTVSNWSSESDRRGHDVDADTKKEIGGLIVQYLAANLRTLIAQAEQFSDPNWLRGQDAADAAVLHGVLTDKAIRLLEALQAPQDEGDV